MAEMKCVPGILEVIGRITSNSESGRLEINTSGTYGTLLFHAGKLVDARLGSLSGFQAVNAAVALRDVEFNFDHVEPASHVSTISPSERVVLKRFFGIEAAEVEEPRATVAPEIGWNEAPEKVVPLTGSETIPVALFAKPRFAVAVFLALVVGVVVGTVVLRSTFKSRQQAASVPSAVVPDAVASDSESSAVKVESSGDVRDLNGEWRVINTVEKTAYRSYDNLEVGFHLTINQHGKDFTGKGEKYFENGQTLPAHRRTPIQVTGTIDGDRVLATFIEDGRTRRTNGRFIWKLQDRGDGLAGTFVSTAAHSSGKSAVTKH